MYNLNQKFCCSDSSACLVLPTLTTAIESRPLQPNPHHVRSVTSTASVTTVETSGTVPKAFSASGLSSRFFASPSRELTKQPYLTSVPGSNPPNTEGTRTFFNQIPNARPQERFSPNSKPSWEWLDFQPQPNAANSFSDDARAGSKWHHQPTCAVSRAQASEAVIKPAQVLKDMRNGSFSRGIFSKDKPNSEQLNNTNKKVPTSTSRGDLQNYTASTGRISKSRVVNYNELMKREQLPAGSGLSNKTKSSSEASTGASPERFFTRNHSSGAGSVSPQGGSAVSMPGMPCVANLRESQGASNTPSGSSQVAFLEGPLPPELRAIIASACASTLPIACYNQLEIKDTAMPHAVGEDGNLIIQESLLAEEAERQARRLLSTSRRLKVYREELLAAQAEFSDMENIVAKDTLVREALEAELTDINAKIAALTKERALCETQVQQQSSVVARNSEKFFKAQERVSVLSAAIENMSQITQSDLLTLQRLVPNLDIENYI